jgi:hypothetical protein
MSAKQLKDSADALIKQNAALRTQNFEASFFQLLRLHNDIVNAMDRAGPKKLDRVISDRTAPL